MLKKSAIRTGSKIRPTGGIKKDTRFKKIPALKLDEQTNNGYKKIINSYLRNEGLKDKSASNRLGKLLSIRKLLETRKTVIKRAQAKIDSSKDHREIIRFLEDNNINNIDLLYRAELVLKLNSLTLEIDDANSYLSKILKNLKERAKRNHKK